MSEKMPDDLGQLLNDADLEARTARRNPTAWEASREVVLTLALQYEEALRLGEKRKATMVLRRLVEATSKLRAVARQEMVQRGPA